MDYLLPKTEEEFDSFMSGERQPRPKILIHPVTNDYYRLIPTDLKRGERAFYVKLEIEPSRIHFLTMDEQALASYRDIELPKISSRYQLRELSLQSDSRKPLAKNEISKWQLFELMIALGNDSGWWPIEDPRYDVESYFKDQKINILFDGNIPIAVHMWDESKLKQTGEIFGSFIATTPDYRGKGLGGYMIKWGLKELASRGCTKYHLDTGDDDLMPGKGDKPSMRALEYYKRLGFEYSHSEVWDPKTLPKDTLSQHGIPIKLCKFNVPDTYFRHPNTGEILGRYTDEFIRGRLNDAFSHGASETRTF